MQFMILRRADKHTEAGVPPGADVWDAMRDYQRQLAAAGVDRGGQLLHPSASGVRLRLSPLGATVVDGPFAETKELIAGFSIIDVTSKEEAIEWLRRFPCGGFDAVELELRESGCADGCAQVDAAAATLDQGKRFVVLLRSSPDLDNEVPVARAKLEALEAHNMAQVKAGVLLAADGLRSSARGARVTLSGGSGGKASVVDGPFTEIKEMIAGYWMIRAASLQEAIEWARRNPYPTGPDVEVEIRQVVDAMEPGAAFTPELRAAEQGMRAEQLESGMRAQLAAAPGSRRPAGNERA